MLLSVCITLQDLIDSDELLDPEDLKRPDPASLKAPSCGEGKKRKACKNWYVLGSRSALLGPSPGVTASLCPHSLENGFPLSCIEE